jgi:hypothetical protein
MANTTLSRTTTRQPKHLKTANQPLYLSMATIGPLCICQKRGRHEECWPGNLTALEGRVHRRLSPSTNNIRLETELLCPACDPTQTMRPTTNSDSSADAPCLQIGPRSQNRRPGYGIKAHPRSLSYSISAVFSFLLRLSPVLDRDTLTLILYILYYYRLVPSPFVIG